MIQIYITKLRIYIYAMKIPMKTASRDFLGDLPIIRISPKTSIGWSWKGAAL